MLVFSPLNPVQTPNPVRAGQYAVSLRIYDDPAQGQYNEVPLFRTSHTRGIETVRDAEGVSSTAAFTA